jgi:hypothetical protein
LAHHFTPMPPRPKLPGKGVRVFSSVIFESLLAQWVDYRDGRIPYPPRMSRAGAQFVWFTDPQSLHVCSTHLDFGERLALAEDTLQEIARAGCAAVFFDTDYVAGRVQSTGHLTSGGAREWVVDGNFPLTLADNEMEAFLHELDGARIGPLEAI